MIYNLVNSNGSIVGYTIIGAYDTDCDIPDSELLDSRLQAAIDDEYIEDDVYSWRRSKRKIGVLI